MAKKTAKSTAKKDPALVGLRTHKGNLQTAVTTFKHSDGRTVTLVGIEHIGESDYFAELRKLVDDLHSAGAQVRYEVLLDKDDIDACRNETERAGLQALNEQINTRFKMFEAFGFGWVTQRNSAMAPDPSWILSDVRAIELVRMQGPTAMTQIPQLRGPQKVHAKIKHLQKKNAKLRLRLGRWSLANTLCTRGDKAQDGKLHPDWWTQRVVYGWRETVEVLKILEQDGDVVAIWGSAHLKGLSEALLRNGFELIDSRWFTAIHKVKF